MWGVKMNFKHITHLGKITLSEFHLIFLYPFLKNHRSKMERHTKLIFSKTIAKNMYFKIFQKFLWYRLVFFSIEPQKWVK